jgi:hypothetical protein
VSAVVVDRTTVEIARTRMRRPLDSAVNVVPQPDRPSPARHRAGPSLIHRSVLPESITAQWG